MKNNNWEEEFGKQFTLERDSFSEHGPSYTVEINPLCTIAEYKGFIKDLLTKKDQEIQTVKMNGYGSYELGKADGKKIADQEHKAELEMIKGEIERLKRTSNNSLSPQAINERFYNDAHNEIIQDTLSILDSHINKLNN